MPFRLLFHLYLLWWFLQVCFKAQMDPLETVYVRIEGDASGLLETLEREIENIKKRLEELEETGEKSSKGGVAAFLKLGSVFGLAAGAADRLLGIVLNLAQAIPAFFQQLGREAVQANAQFETFGVQFETLLGSAGAAKGRLEELAKFGVETPFELPEIVEASRQLEIAGGAALSTGENLRLVGDMAAGVNRSFLEVSMWVGRLYDNLQSGKPFGDAAMRLNELGLLSGQVRRQLEDMQKAGKDGAEIWAFFAETMGEKFGGNMARLAKTFQGITSNIADFRGMLLRLGGEELFEQIKDAAEDFLNILNENQDALIKIAKFMGDTAAGGVEFFRDLIKGVDFKSIFDQVKEFLDWLNRVSRAGQALSAVGKQFIGAFQPLVAVFLELNKLFAPANEGFKGLGDIMGHLDEAMITLAQIIAMSTAGWKGFFAALAPVGEVIVQIAKALAALSRGDFQAAGEAGKAAADRIKAGLIDVDAGVQAMRDSIRQSAADIDRLTNPIEEVGQAVDDNFPIEEEDILEDGAVDAVAEKLKSLSNQMIDAADQRDQALVVLEQTHQEKIFQILSDANEKRIAIEENYAEAIAELQQETEDRRLDIIENTRRQLADLATQTNKQLNEKRSEFQKEELRETEDHLKEMRRLQEDFLFNLQDAVRERDARAILDLQRQFRTESGRREEDFQTQQGRGQEDFSQELDQIRQNEADRRAEIMVAQEQALLDLQEHEEEKRLEIETRRAESLMTLQENLQERLNKEQQSYTERQTALEEALAKQLEAITKGLADDDKVTEEGARKILETLAEYFGVDGQIDQLMESFNRRRKIRAEIQVNFSGGEAAAGGTPPGPGTAMTPLSGPIPTFAEGGMMLASKPTLALFGESGPEFVQFTPLSQVTGGNGGAQKLQIEFSGSAPPGIGSDERDAIAGVLLAALRDTGVLEG